MIVGVLEIHLKLPSCQNLKDKRKIVRSLIERSQREFRVAAAEVGDNELWGNSVLGFSAVSSNSAHIESVLRHVLDEVSSNPQVDIEAEYFDLVRPFG